ncbi:MAG: hypothetical protein AAGB06_04740, partial [Verrucomicrobiota bacterium]
AAYQEHIASSRIDYLISIYQNEEVRYQSETPSLLAGDSPYSFTLEDGENSVVKLYRGTQGQGPDGFLTNNLGPQPRNGGVAHVVHEDLFLGQSSGGATSPLNLEYEFASIPRFLKLDPLNPTSDPFNDDISFHHNNYSVLVPEVIYGLLTLAPPFGLGLAASKIVESSFLAAAYQHISDNIWASVVIDSQTPIRDIILSLADLHYGIIRENRGKIEYKMQRSSDSAIDVPQGHFISEPKETEQEWIDTVGSVKVSYTARDRRGDPLPAQAFNPIANPARTERISRRDIDNEVTAQKHANALAAIMGRKSIEWEFELLDVQAYRSLLPGDVLRPTYPLSSLDGIKRMRIDRVLPPDPGKTGIVVKGHLDAAALIEESAGNLGFSYTPPEVDFDDVDFRILALSPEDQGDAPDGFMVAASRPDTATNAYITNFSSDGIQWQPQQKRAAFASQVTVLGWNQIAPGRITMEIRFTYQHDHEFFARRQASGVTPDLELVLGFWKMHKVSGEVEFTGVPVWSSLRYDAPIESLASEAGYDQYDWRIRLQSGIRQTFSLRDGDLDFDVYPSSIGYLGARADFSYIKSNAFVFRRGENREFDGSARYWAVQGVKRTKIQEISESAQAQYFIQGVWQTYVPTAGPGDPPVFASFFNATTDECTIPSHGFTENQKVEELRFATTYPAPLEPGTEYYLNVVDSNTVRFRAEYDGPIIDITSEDSGTMELRIAADFIGASWGPAVLPDSNIGDPGSIPYDNPASDLNDTTWDQFNDDLFSDLYDAP